VESARDVGVADGGNQTGVEVGGGVSVGVRGIGVARSSSSSAAQDVINVIARSEQSERRSNLPVNRRLLRFARTDMRNVKKFITIL
jgi:hypothetical protein